MYFNTRKDFAVIKKCNAYIKIHQQLSKVIFSDLSDKLFNHNLEWFPILFHYNDKLNVENMKSREESDTRNKGTDKIKSDS